MHYLLIVRLHDSLSFKQVFNAPITGDILKEKCRAIALDIK